MIVREAELRWTARRQVAAKLSEAAQVAEVARREVGADPREHVLVFWRDARGESLVLHQVAVGTLQGCLVHPRELFRAAIVAGASSLIWAHTHPSGVAAASDPDRAAHDRLRRAGSLLGIEVLDGVIVTDQAHASHAEGDWK